MNDNRRQQLWENCRRLGTASSDEQKGKHILPVEAYIMRLIRAAQFGDERAREQAGRLPGYAAYGAKTRSGYHCFVM